MMVSKNGLFIMKNPKQKWIIGGTPILENHHIYIHIRIYTITRYLRGFEPPFPPGQAPQDLPRSFLGAWTLTVW